jgi:serine/threonine-protein kinase
VVDAARSWTCPTCGGTYPGDFALCPRDATPRADEVVQGGDPLVGEVLGRTYRIVRVLGEGGMARLYEAEHLRVDLHFAVKVLHGDLAREADQLARFEREARAAARIRSAHVVTLVDVLRTADGRPCLVEELLEGEDLQALLDRETKLDVARTIPIARQICRAVADAHAAGVVHRDLKPSNVFLCRREGGMPLVKVFDFGVAKLEDDEKLTRTDAVMGTAAYMSPEQARKAADAGPLADVYSIGAVMYHMLAGQPPYGNVPALSRFALVLHEEPARPRDIEPSIPTGVEAVIQHAMAREREARIKSATELEGQLAAFDKQPAAAPTRAAASQTSLPKATTPVSIDVSAIAIARRARVARPFAVTIAALSCIVLGAWIAGLLAATIGAASSSESALVAVIAIGGAAGVGLVHARALRKKWNSSPAVLRYIKPTARATLACVVTIGALDVVTYGAIALAHAEPIGAAVRLVLAGVAAGVGLGWERLGLGERLRDRIG